MVAPQAICQFLREAHRYLRADAIAYVHPDREALHVVCLNQNDEPGIRHTIELAVDTFLMECRNRSEALVRNKVRYETDGPLIGRFMVVATHDYHSTFSGIVLAFRRPDEPEFESDDVRQAARFDRLLNGYLALPVDSMTGLLSLAQLAHWRRAEARDETGAILFGDLDRLHVINDMWGFEMGDRVIGVAARALAQALGGEDVVLGRIGGDKFGVLLPGRAVPEARVLAEKLRQAIACAPLSAEMAAAPLTMSFGVASLRDGERGFEHALAAAEVACKTAKDRGRNRVEAYQSTDASILRRRDDISTAARLRGALEEGRFRIFGQPIASLLQPDETHRYEMLVRIVDEKEKLLLPAQFMAAAARYQLLPVIDRCVVGHVLRKMGTAIRQPGTRMIHASLNLSGASISEPRFLDWLLSEIDSTGAPPERLTFELTEATILGNPTETRTLMERLVERGCTFALDNFGTGLSSVSHVSSLPFKTLKIDGSFVREILHSERAQSLVHAVAQLAYAMGMDTVAEFAETPEVCMRLIELRVQFGQGYAIGKPKPLERILDLPPALAQAS
jgi:diguanylate cyclase (GGDEF)-like protein